MLKKVSWLINRLRMMPPGEIPHRMARTLIQIVERFRIARGWVPIPEEERFTARPLFGTSPDIGEAWRRFFSVDEEGVTRALAGHVTFFGREFTVGRIPRWHLDPDTGREAPVSYGKTINHRDESVVGNIKTLWELSRHQHLIPLAANYAVSGDPRCRMHVVAQIDDWISNNPFGLGIHWNSSLEVALRGIAWATIHGLIALRDGPDGLISASADKAAMRTSIFQHCYFIRHHLSRYSSANNHLIGELVGLWCLTSVFSFGRQGELWRGYAKEELEREALLQVHPDGVLKEQATHYQLEVMEYLLFSICVGSATDLPLANQVTERLFAMVSFIRALKPEGGRLPQIGDSDEGTVTRFRLGELEEPEFEVMAAIEYVFGASNAPRYEKAFWYRRMIANPEALPTLAAEPLAEDQGESLLFPEGGYSILRSRALTLAFDAGPLGYPSIAAHGHADALSFCLAWNGVWWLVDPGTYAYHGDQTYRNYFKGTTAHNTGTVNGQDQSRSGGPFLWIRHAQACLESAETAQDGTLITSGYHDGYRGLGVRHRRRIEVVPGTSSVSVVDVFETATEESRNFALNFHFAPEIALVLNGSVCYATQLGTSERLELRLDTRLDWSIHRASTSPLLGWHSPGLGRKVPAWTLRGEVASRTEATFKTEIMPSRAAARATTSVEDQAPDV